MNKKTFAVEIDGKKVELAVVKPSHRAMQQAQIVYNRAFREAVSPADGKPGALLRQNLDRVAREQNIWDDAKQAQYKELAASLAADEKLLAGGGIKLSEARKAAIRMRKNRYELRELLAERNALDAVTAESFGDQARFNYLVSACTVYADSGKPYYKDAEDYLGREDDPAALPAAQHMGSLFYGLDDNYADKLPENKFLRDYKLVDDSGHLIDSKGRRVDAEGRLVDDKGRWVNEAGELVDADGNLLTEAGDYKVDFKPFLTDAGEPVSVAVEVGTGS